jgi:hypothetical protein
VVVSADHRAGQRLRETGPPRPEEVHSAQQINARDDLSLFDLGAFVCSARVQLDFGQ